MGQECVGRYREAGWPFTIADGAATLMILLSFGDCASQSCKDQKNALVVSGAVLLVASRIVQVTELVIYGAQNDLFTSPERASSQTGDQRFQVVIAPTVTEPGLLATGALRF